MPLPPPIGLFSWIVIGMVVGLAAPTSTFGPRRWRHALVATVGGLAGGLLATLLGFGGLVGFDLRALVTATLGAMLSLLVARLVRAPER